MRSTTLLSLCLLVPVLGHAQARGAWTTFGADPQRTGWNKGETELTPENVKNLKLEWSVRLDNQPKALNGLTVPIVRGSLATPRGVKDMVVVGAPRTSCT